MPRESTEDHLKDTLRRLEIIKAHLDTHPRSGRLAGKVAIVTGVGSLTGIGRATVKHFAHEGAKHIYALDYDDTNLEELKTTIQGKYTDVKLTVKQCDAADEQAISDIVDLALKEHDRLDIFFANAAVVGSPIPIWDADMEDLAETMRVNVSR